MTTLLLAYAAGLLTLINPCVLPILPIVLTGALQASPRGPIYMAAGMGVTFVAFGLLVNAFGHAIGLDDVLLAQIGAVMMIGFGLVLLVPRFSEGFTTVTAGFAARADSQIDTLEGDSAKGLFLTGALLGVVWSPCIGPTLGGAISLASQGQSLLWAGTIMAAFALGVATLIIALGYGARRALQTHLRRFAESSKPFLGGVFLLVGFGLLFNVHHMIEAWALDVLPPWLIDLSVSI
ncbi:MAG: cytochrome c biogenesis CcdA family protein [Pseudomonadota bacterium]